jgi:hypothetical protein
MRWGTCTSCGGWAYVEDEPSPESGCDDLTFAEHEQGAREAFDQGNKDALLHFISFCFLQRRDVPEWAQEKFRDAVARAKDFEIKSWDEVFGRPLEKGAHLDARRRKHRVLAEVWKSVNKRRRAGDSLNKELYEAVGKELGVGGATVVEEMYERILREFREGPPGYAKLRSARVGYPVKDSGRGGERRAIVQVLDTFEPPFDPQDKSSRKD